MFFVIYNKFLSTSMYPRCRPVKKKIGEEVNFRLNLMHHLYIYYLKVYPDISPNLNCTKTVNLDRIRGRFPSPLLKWGLYLIDWYISVGGVKYCEFLQIPNVRGGKIAEISQQIFIPECRYIFSPEYTVRMPQNVPKTKIQTLDYLPEKKSRDFFFFNFLTFFFPKDLFFKF